ncbi:MAG: hypothetical protein JSV82_08785 [Planctomycetota bacterium]|nr:MAG: hypothetical protein JSV82_08785 [Planctomycetota bacterium]
MGKYTMEQVINNGRKTRVATINEYAAMKGVTPEKVQKWVKKNRITTLRDNGRTLIDLEAPQTAKTRLDESQLPSRQTMIRTFLAKAEASAQKSEISRKRWQLLAFVSLLLLAATLYAAVWAHAQLSALTNYIPASYMGEGRLQAANLKVAELTQQIEQLRITNAHLTLENAGLEAQYSLLAIEGQSIKEPAQAEPAQPEPPAHDEERLTAIRNRMYPEDMTKDELIAALGRPDRLYKTELYEQLVYFERSPSRFWFKNGPFLHAAR